MNKHYDKIIFNLNNKKMEEKEIKRLLRLAVKKELSIQDVTDAIISLHNKAKSDIIRRSEKFSFNQIMKISQNYDGVDLAKFLENIDS